MAKRIHTHGSIHKDNGREPVPPRTVMERKRGVGTRCPDVHAAAGYGSAWTRTFDWTSLRAGRSPLRTITAPGDHARPGTTAPGDHSDPETTAPSGRSRPWRRRVHAGSPGRRLRCSRWAR